MRLRRHTTSLLLLATGACAATAGSPPAAHRTAPATSAETAEAATATDGAVAATATDGSVATTAPTAASAGPAPTSTVATTTAASPSPRPPVITAFALDGHTLQLPAPIVFATGSAALDEAASAPTLWYLYDYLMAKTSISLLRIEGHQATGGVASVALSLQRAQAVSAWLVAHGIACQRLLSTGFGDTKPVATNASPEGRAQKQRITVVNAALRGRAIGGMPVDGGASAQAASCTP